MCVTVAKLLFISKIKAKHKRNGLRCWQPVWLTTKRCSSSAAATNVSPQLFVLIFVPLSIIYTTNYACRFVTQITPMIRLAPNNCFVYSKAKQNTLKVKLNVGTLITPVQTDWIVLVFFRRQPCRRHYKEITEAFVI